MSEVRGDGRRPWWRTPLADWFPLIREREEQVFLGLALAIGAITGLAVVAFILLTEKLGMRLYPVGSVGWRRGLIPVFGSIGMGYLLFRYFPNARGSGVPQTKAALFASGGRITFRTVFGKFFCTSATLACGIPLGREGPSVQVGGGIASMLGRSLGLSTEKVKALIPAGAAAAIAAAFNTPLAAVLFALEEIVGDLHAPVLGSVVLASGAAWLVLRLLLGNYPLFQVPAYKLVHASELGLYAVLGLLGGLLSAAFTKVLTGLRRRFLNLPRRTLWFQPVAGGIVVGLAGFFVPQVLGVGYGYVGEALNSNMALKLMALLLVLKFVAVTVSYASGNAGGIFAPSLFLGAMLGGTLGGIAHHFLPQSTATSGAYALVGMGTLFAGIVRAPMTSVLMIFETTQDYAVIVPLMISNLISFFVSSRLQREPIYEVLASQDGIHLPTRAVRERPAKRQVQSVMRPSEENLTGDMTAEGALAFVRASRFGSWPVCDEEGVIGMVSRSALESAAKAAGSPALGEIVGRGAFPHLHSDQPLSLALERLGESGLDRLPVVSRADVHQMEGVVSLSDVLGAYGVTTNWANRS
jgi:CIC family chloride channel protein